MAGYTKEFLIDAFIWRYQSVLEKDTKEEFDAYYAIVEGTYDKFGKDQFRVFSSLDAAEIQKFRLATGQ
jgi:hypothetical protein